MKTVTPDFLSTVSLFLQSLVVDKVIGTATGSVVSYGGAHYLITNWHVLAGRHPDSKQPMSSTGGVPDSIVIAFHSKAQFGKWVFVQERLVNSEGEPIWFEHPKGSEIDIAALPLKRLEEIQVFELPLKTAEENIVAQPGMTVSIVGYPMGLIGSPPFPIWKTGHIASEPELDHNNLPLFLIDATTRSGMSGSPVYLRASGLFQTNEGRTAMSVGGPKTRFLGIYSGRVNSEIEIGRVWKPIALQEVLQSVGRA